MNSSNKVDSQMSQAHEESRAESKRSGCDESDGGGDGDEEEEILISEDEMRKLKQVFKKLCKGGETISVDEALIIIKSISEDSMFAEEDIYDILESEEA